MACKVFIYQGGHGFTKGYPDGLWVREPGQFWCIPIEKYDLTRFGRTTKERTMQKMTSKFDRIRGSIEKAIGGVIGDTGTDPLEDITPYQLWCALSEIDDALASETGEDSIIPDNWV